MEDLVTDIDAEIEKYLGRLRSERNLARRDLDELEDHLRELTNDLRTAGMPAAEAVTEAARRLGDPRQLAREHARVRSPLGRPLSASRAVIGAALFMIPHIRFLIEHYDEADFSWRGCLVMAAFMISAIALAARVKWARAVVLGFSMHRLTLFLLMPEVRDGFPLNSIVGLGVVALLVPWSRKELSLAVITLALQAWGCVSAVGVVIFQTAAADSAHTLRVACGTVAVVCAVASCIGTARGERWSAITSAASALALFVAVGTLFAFPFLQEFAYGGVGSGAIALTIAAVISYGTRTRMSREPPATLRSSSSS
jgi:hypothetical protein